MTTTNSIDTLVTPTNGLKYSFFTLSNGLNVILHQDKSTPIITINILYQVGAKDEYRGISGFSHLFEHLMFEGSKNIPKGEYDLHCTKVGGENNAYTTNDYTDYYIALPSNCLELGLWLESDRMAEFSIGKESLETQKSVVIEEKKQYCDNTPYGNSTFILRELAFDRNHPYSWDTIGTEEDIQNADMNLVRNFYQKYYTPNNATLVLAGDFDSDEAMILIEKYFGNIPKNEAQITRYKNNGNEFKHGQKIVRDDALVPLNSAFLLYHVPNKYSKDYRALELLTIILSDGESSRFYRALEYEQEIASDTESYIFEGDLSSLFHVYAIAENNEVSSENLEISLLECIKDIAQNGISEDELEKSKNRITSRVTYYVQSLMNRAERLAYFSVFYNNPDLAFNEASFYEEITKQDIQDVCKKYLFLQKPNILHLNYTPLKK